MKNFPIPRKETGLLLAVALLTFPFLAMSAELEEGTVIHAGNVDELLDDTFDGHKISDLLVDRHIWLIKEHNLRIKVGHADHFHTSDSMWELTRQHAGEASLHPETRQLENWSGAGIPFPPDQIDPEDPQAADKLLWNFWVHQMDGYITELPFTYLLIDGNRGLERTQDWWWLRVKYTGRYGEGVEPNINDEGENVIHKTLIVAQYPRDIRGLGTYFEFFLPQSKTERAFAYLPAVRRVRRLSGQAWMDPIGGTDQLNDDVNIWNTYPNRYDTNRVIERRWILHPGDVDWSSYPEKDSQSERYPYVDHENAPYWNPSNVTWTPREVWVIEAIAPDVHPYGKKILYYDVEAPWIHMGETYDKGGDFWKWIVWMHKSLEGEDGTKQVIPAQGMVMDYQRMHATVFVSTPRWKINPRDRGPDDASLGTLQAMGR